MKKRILSFLLVCFLAAAMLPVSASAADIVDEGFCGDDLTWCLTDDGALTIAGSGAMYNYDGFYDDDTFDLPDYIAYYNDEITSVSLPSGLTHIGRNAFFMCSNVTSISIPDSVTSIGGNAFAYTGITSISIPSATTNINLSAFDACYSLTSIAVSGSNTVYSSSGGTSGTAGLLYSKDKKTLLRCPEGIEGPVTLISGTTAIEDCAFWECLNVTKVNFQSSLQAIGNYAFSYCESLTTLSLPASLTAIGDEAFEGSGLTAVKIPANVKEIGSLAFASCYDLTAFTVDSANQFFSAANGILYNKDKTILYCCPGGQAGDISIPSSVKVIGDGAFFDCSEITSVSIPDSVEEIGFLSFAYCLSLTELTLPSNLSEIAMGTFLYSDGLETVTIPASVKSIGNAAFSGCESITTIYFKGTPAEWDAFFVDDGNEPLLDAEVICTISLGDLNRDESVDLKDVSLMFQWWNGKAELSDSEVTNGDINSDSYTDLRDAAALYATVF